MSQRAARSQEGLPQRRCGLPCEHSHALSPPDSATNRRTAPSLPFPSCFSSAMEVKEPWSKQFLGLRPKFLPREEVPDTQTPGFHRGLTAFEICGGSEGEGEATGVVCTLGGGRLPRRRLCRAHQGRSAPGCRLVAPKTSSLVSKMLAPSVLKILG